MKQNLQYNNGIFQGNLDKQFNKFGLGTFLYDDSTLYFGEWKSDQYHGEGIIHLPYGGYFIGNFEYHNIEGVAFLVTSDQILIANYQNSVLQGEALRYQNNQFELIKFISGQGEVIEKFQNPNLLNENYKQKLIWIENFKFQSVDRGIGVSISKNNTLRIGCMNQGSLDGIGRIIFENGDIEDGFYKTNRLQHGFIFDKFLNQYQEINLILSKNGLQNQIIKTGKGFPSKLIRNFREDIHKNSKSFCDRIQEKPIFHQQQMELSQQSKQCCFRYEFDFSQSPACDTKELIENYGSLKKWNQEDILNEGEIPQPKASEGAQAQTLYFRQLNNFSTNYIEKFRRLEIFDDIDISHFKNKKKIFDEQYQII